MTLADGGLFSSLDLSEAILKCREEVDNDEDIIVDIVLCTDDPLVMPKLTKD